MGPAAILPGYGPFIAADTGYRGGGNDGIGFGAGAVWVCLCFFIYFYFSVFGYFLS